MEVINAKLLIDSGRLGGSSAVIVRGGLRVMQQV